MKTKFAVAALLLSVSTSALAQQDFRDPVYTHSVQMCDFTAGMIMDAYFLRHQGLDSLEIVDSVHQMAQTTDLFEGRFTKQLAGDLVHNWVYVIPRQSNTQLMQEAAGYLATEFYSKCVENAGAQALIRAYGN